MIPGIMAGQMRVAGGGPGVVSFISATGASYISSGTAISSPASPSSMLDGDGLFAIVLARSALTPPSGWALVFSQAVAGAVAQTVNIFRKNTVTSADGSTAFNWTQASSGRMGLSYMTCRSTSAGMSVIEAAGMTTSTPSSSFRASNVPVLTASVAGELFLMASCNIFASSSVDSNTWAAPTGATLCTTATQADNRLAAATHARDSGQSNGTNFTFTASTASADELAGITVRIAPT